ncbi:MAG: Antitoxin Phd YefM, type toxin-antitoxin system [Actinomycetota bacterium]
MTKKSARREMPNTMSITELSQNASGAVARAVELGEDIEPVVLLRHNKPIAVLLEYEAYQQLLAAYIEVETEDVIRMFERDRGIKREDLADYIANKANEPTVPWEQVRAELGLPQLKYYGGEGVDDEPTE